MKTTPSFRFRKRGGIAMLGALLFAPTVDIVSAQGTLLLSTVFGPRPRIVIDGHSALPEDHVFVQVLVAGASSLTGIYDLDSNSDAAFGMPRARSQDDEGAMGGAAGALHRKPRRRVSFGHAQGPTTRAPNVNQRQPPEK